MDEQLKRKYEETDYVVDDDPPIVLRVNEQHDGVRILMASFNVETAAFITAWNPGSQPLDLDTNYDRQADLLSDIEQLRCNYFVGRGEHPEDGWVEDSYLVLGISRDDADALAIKYGQLAYIWISLSGVPELVIS